MTEHGRAAVADLAQRYGLSQDAVGQMAQAVANGGGTMAQFNIP
ncbi:MAG: SHOCT domain-containing protein, partial [Pseudomonadota bacterium]